MNIFKLSSQVKKVVRELGIVENNETNLQTILQTLSAANNEYQQIPEATFKETVRGIFTKSIAPTSTERLEPSNPATPNQKSNMNLNQSMTIAQKSLGLKRSIQEEPTPVLTPSFSTIPHSDSQVSLSNNNNNNNSSSKPPEKNSSPSQPKLKKRKSSNYLPEGNNNDAAPSSSTKIGSKPSSSNSFLTERPVARFSDLAGLENVLDQIKELVIYPLMYSSLYAHLGVCPPCGILLNGPSGCGKTLLANAIAGETGLNYFKVSFFF
jgi:SpoVK/Ycf46/Vps4 family AAA+-type ATPase